MKKILDFIIIFLLIFLIVSLFKDDKQDVQIVESAITLKAVSDSYTVPAWIKLEVENKTKNDIEIDVCNDFKVKYIQTDSFIEFGEELCNNNLVSIKSWEKTEVDYSGVYEDFKEKWNYVVKYEFDTGEFIENEDWELIPKIKETTTSFEVESRGTFTKLFIYLFYAPAYNLIIFLVDLFAWSLGWAIITITIILRGILLWPQHKMLVSQKKLQAIQPKIKKIQEEFKGQPQVLGQKMMELYKTEKVNPMGSCGFLLIQMPILLVIYNVILYIEDASNHYYLYTFLKDFDFSSMSFSFFWINLLWTGWITWLLLWGTVWILQFTQIWLSNKNNPIAKKNDVVLEKKKWAQDYSSMMPDPAVMQKAMLYWMPVMVAIFTYNFPVWLGMYWGMSTLFMIAQQLIVNRKK